MRTAEIGKSHSRALDDVVALGHRVLRGCLDPAPRPRVRAAGFDQHALDVIEQRLRARAARAHRVRRGTSPRASAHRQVGAADPIRVEKRRDPSICSRSSSRRTNSGPGPPPLGRTPRRGACRRRAVRAAPSRRAGSRRRRRAAARPRRSARAPSAGRRTRASGRSTARAGAARARRARRRRRSGGSGKRSSRKSRIAAESGMRAPSTSSTGRSPVSGESRR